MKTLILTVGLPRSGKSTWAKATGYPIVSPDAIRWALHGTGFLTRAEPMVWGIAHIMVAALFEAGHGCVVLDACNTTAARRNEWRDPRWELDYEKFSSSKAECIQRAKDSGRADLIPVIERMAEQFEEI